MILAAGRGERMRPLTDILPKPLQKVGDLTLIERHVTALAKAGIKHIVINLAWLGHLIEQHLGDGARFNLNIDYSYEQTALGTLGGVVNALTLFKEEQFLVISADIVTDFDFNSLLNHSIDSHDLAHLVLIEESHFKGDFSLQSHRVTMPEAQSFTYGNIGLYQRRGLMHFQPGQILDLGQYLRQLVSSNQVSGQLFSGLWSNVGTIEELDRINQLLDK
ncbi:nucleotidyltransferase family protein [Ferrovum sp. PN-J185]|uniref:nucleotidyltransferase family protein n=1 Tax=Ferrovum sp. PN-J185 TaxID=1356306 RepID=UPI00227140FE|nr:nucleotidyltransferase family protein [Ferrovum sp. PN-J185]MCC6067943.1 nucleotidyltransferase family protein [Ferrovum sp. PN-J185]